MKGPGVVSPAWSRRRRRRTPCRTVSALESCTQVTARATAGTKKKAEANETQDPTSPRILVSFRFCIRLHVSPASAKFGVARGGSAAVGQIMVQSDGVVEWERNPNNVADVQAPKKLPRRRRSARVALAWSGRRGSCTRRRKGPGRSIVGCGRRSTGAAAGWRPHRSRLPRDSVGYRHASRQRVKAHTLGSQCGDDAGEPPASPILVALEAPETETGAECQRNVGPRASSGSGTRVACGGATEFARSRTRHQPERENPGRHRPAPPPRTAMVDTLPVAPSGEVDRENG